ncbi:hypothetical protein Metev_1241 [Methanohalobium evestigatum Z-7303]|uniref:Sulfotransferase n=1 Tax=Methanohalobium evestigatum (strain ATCC BAA-1072 / DSM 3721 / NBRC 107634 / OCM 161 / Z-7303) TaxID=644295 RepID=D7E7N7_METEZ|nr:sulfotransferase [Methanohalobium evestigatum]ADI74110.1 hypothetical protein Metev_1241 [Methanohalobium evestigatum Z-7303]
MDKNNDKLKVIYIMGSGHTGSTLLDLCIGAHPKIQSCGEFKPHLFWGNYQKNKLCGCGISSQSCPFWSQVINDWKSKTGIYDLNVMKNSQDKFENISINQRINLDSYETEFYSYLIYNQELLYSISYISDKPILVDSTKNSIRALNLSLMPNIELILIHLVRNGNAVTWSNMKKDRSVKSSSKNWLISNLRSEIVYHKIKTKKLRIRYEDFINNPTDTLNSIGNLLGLDFSNISKNLINGTGIEINSHLLAGNRKVFSSSNLKLNPDNTWKQKMSYKNRIYSKLLTFPLAIKYGYL